MKSKGKYYLVEEAENFVVDVTEDIKEAVKFYAFWSERQSRFDNASVYYSEKEYNEGEMIGPEALCLLSVYHYPTDEPRLHREKFKEIRQEDCQVLEKALPELRTW